MNIYVVCCALFLELLLILLQKLNYFLDQVCKENVRPPRVLPHHWQEKKKMEQSETEVCHQLAGELAVVAFFHWTVRLQMIITTCMQCSLCDIS